MKLYHLSCSLSILAFPQWISSQYIHLLSDINALPLFWCKRIAHSQKCPKFLVLMHLCTECEKMYRSKIVLTSLKYENKAIGKTRFSGHF